MQKVNIVLNFKAISGADPFDSGVSKGFIGGAQNIGAAVRTNRKKISGGSTPDRDRRFSLSLSAAGSVREAGRAGAERGCQKREMIGNCKNPGVKWQQAPTDVDDHDFRRRQGHRIPYGIYDTQANRGCVFLGTSHETSAFAVSCLGARRCVWKQELPSTVRGPGTQRHRFSLFFRRLQNGIPFACSARSEETGKPSPGHL